jgi:hypothetical protein
MELYKAYVIDFIFDDIYLKTNAHMGAMLWVYCAMTDRSI